MGKIRNNVAVKKLRGMIGGTLVYRDGPNGETIVAAAPSLSKKEPTETQIARRRQFRSADIFAKRVQRDVSLFQSYSVVVKTKGWRSVRNLAIADYFALPEIWEIDTSLYTGQAGSVITIIVTTLLRAKKVNIMIYSPDGTVLENGDATPESDDQTWKYITTSANPSLTGSKIVVMAVSVPGNQSSQQTTL